MVLLTITIVAHDAIAKYCEAHGKVEVKDGEPSLDSPAVGDPISHGQLIEVSSRLRTAHGQHGAYPIDVSLETLLKGAKIWTSPPKPKPEKSPEYVRLMARLRADEEQREYERMTNPLPPQETFQRRYPGARTYGASTISAPVVDDVDEATYADVNRQMTLIINVLVTIIACSVGIWITAWHWPTPARLGLSMGGSGVVAAAEVAIYLGYIRRMSDAKTKERRVVESKEVLETWVLDGQSGKRKVEGTRNESLRHRKGKHS